MLTALAGVFSIIVSCIVLERPKYLSRHDAAALRGGTLCHRQCEEHHYYRFSRSIEDVYQGISVGGSKAQAWIMYTLSADGSQTARTEDLIYEWFKTRMDDPCPRRPDAPWHGVYESSASGPSYWNYERVCVD
ncbi:MAG: hypothetical protein R6V05_12045 [Candidatus Brocadiia bacterium]